MRNNLAALPYRSSHLLGALSPLLSQLYFWLSGLLIALQLSRSFAFVILYISYQCDCDYQQLSLKSRAPSLPLIDLPKFAGGYSNLVNLGLSTAKLTQSQMLQDGQGQGQGAVAHRKTVDRSKYRKTTE